MIEPRTLELWGNNMLQICLHSIYSDFFILYNSSQFLVGKNFGLDIIQHLLEEKDSFCRAASDELSMSISLASPCALDINLDANTFSPNHAKAI